MNETMTQSSTGVRRGWFVLAVIGTVLVAIPLIVLCLVMLDKKHFGGLVGSMFLPVIMGGIFAGALLLLVATWFLPVRRNWRGIVLFAWALIAITSPLFGWLFLLPWGVLVLMLPLVAWILYGLRA